MQQSLKTEYSSTKNEENTVNQQLELYVGSKQQKELVEHLQINFLL